MGNEAHMKELVLRHGRRVRRLWFMGACLTFCIGAVVAGLSLYQLVSDARGDPDGGECGRYDRSQFKEGMKASAAVGLGFSATLLALGGFSYFVCRRFVERGTCIHARFGQSAINTLLSAGMGRGPASLLGLIAPVRTAVFTFERDGREIRQMGHLFANEAPYRTDESQCWAIASEVFGNPVAMLVCEGPQADRQGNA